MQESIAALLDLMWVILAVMVFPITLLWGAAVLLDCIVSWALNEKD